MGRILTPGEQCPARPEKPPSRAHAAPPRRAYRWDEGAAPDRVRALRAPFRSPIPHLTTQTKSNMGRRRRTASVSAPEVAFATATTMVSMLLAPVQLPLSSPLSAVPIATALQHRQASPAPQRIQARERVTCVRTRPGSPTKDKPAAHRPPAGLGIESPYPPGCEAAANGESPDCSRWRLLQSQEGPHRLRSCVKRCSTGMLAAHGQAWWASTVCRTVKYTYSMPWAALAPPFVVNGTSLTVRVHHGTNILPLGARKAARVNAELRASKIRRIDGTELAHDGPNAPGIITNRPAVCEIWSIDGAGSASRHRGQAQRKGVN